jgi:hypothetical protein
MVYSVAAIDTYIFDGNFPNGNYHILLAIFHFAVATGWQFCYDKCENILSWVSDFIRFVLLWNDRIGNDWG